METLVLMPGKRHLDYALFGAEQRAPRMIGHLCDFGGAAPSDWFPGEKLAPESFIIALRVIYGGERFTHAVMANEAVLAELREMVPRSPVQLPRALALAEDCCKAFPHAPIALVFETAFFAGLPARETVCGIDPDVAAALGIRRHGYNGVYHQAAAAQAWRRNAAARLISICLEPKPEIAAVHSGGPVMVTGGATPLEGLPGETSCGEIDPSIVLALARELKWGPEQIDRLLTHESGLLGLTGRRLTLRRLYDEEGADLSTAREFYEHRLLQACGAGIAALGGLDEIVFSGRYHELGERLGPWLAERLAAAMRRGGGVNWSLLEDTRERLIADQALAAAVEQGAAVGVV